MTPRGEPARKPSIALIGMRGAGKTTVGRELAQMLSVPLVDTDDIVVASAGMPVARIFATEGAAGFRAREREAVRAALAASPSVISVGGGAVLDVGNVNTLRQAATIVWLTARPEVLGERIRADPTSASSRPDLTELGGLAEIQQLFDQRASHYDRASDFSVDTESRAPREIAEAIASLLGLLGGE